MCSLKEHELHSLLLVKNPDFAIFVLKTHLKAMSFRDYGITLHSNWFAEDKFHFNFAEILQRVSCEPLGNLISISGSGLRNLSSIACSKMDERQAEDVR